MTDLKDQAKQDIAKVRVGVRAYIASHPLKVIAITIAVMAMLGIFFKII